MATPAHPLHNRRITDEAQSAGEFEFQRTQRRDGIPLPCEAHAEWLKRLDDRMWAILFAVGGGAVASVVTLLIILIRNK